MFSQYAVLTLPLPVFSFRFRGKDVVPLYKQATTVTYITNNMVEKALLTLNSMGGHNPVTYSEMANPNVNDIKADGRSVNISVD